MAQDYLGRCRVNAVAPGITLPSGGQSKEEFEMVARHNLLGRASSSQHVAAAVRMLLSNTAINGQCIWVDGGKRFVDQPRDVLFMDEGTVGACFLDFCPTTVIGSASLWVREWQYVYNRVGA